MAGNFKIQKFNNGSVSNATRVICSNFNNVLLSGVTADSNLPFLSKSNNTVTVIKTIQEVANKTDITYNRSTGVLQASEFKEE